MDQEKQQNEINNNFDKSDILNENKLLMKEIEKNKDNNESNKIKKWLKQNLILILTVFGVFGGIGFGLLGRLYKPLSIDVLTIIYFPGELLLRILKMLILPLIISSLITGLAQLDPKSSGKMGSLALIYYFTTTIIASITGIILVITIHPGNPNQKLVKSDNSKGSSSSSSINTLDAMLDIIRNMFPENIIQACTQQVGTVYRKKQIPIYLSSLLNITNLTSNNTNVVHYEIIKELKYTDGTNVMGIVVFSFAFGIYMGYAKSEAQVMYDFFVTLNDLIMRLVSLIMWFAPFGILSLIATNLIKIDDLTETAKRLGFYMLTVIIGLIIHSMFTTQMIYFLVTRKNPFSFLKGMLQAWLTAIGTASSAATLPITFRCLEENNKIDKRVTRFMLPLGATINMDGTALYEAVAAIFIAQLNDRHLTIGQLIAVSMSATVTSIGAASIPSAALVTMLIVLSSIGLPIEDLSYIIAVDWLLDRLRTSINVLGDAYGAAVVAHLSKKQLKKLDEEIERECAEIISPKNIIPQNNLEQEISEYNCVSNENTITKETKFLRRSSNVEESELSRLSPIQNLSIYRPPSLGVINAIRKKSRIAYVNPSLASPLSFQTIPYIHSVDSETNV